MAMPIMPRHRNEQDESFNNMIFYVVIALGIVSPYFFWGTLNV
jgi:hypothetical protein